MVNKEVQHQEHRRLDVFGSVAGWLRSRDAQDVGAGWAYNAMRVCFRRPRLVLFYSAWTQGELIVFRLREGRPVCLDIRVPFLRRFSMRSLRYGDIS